MKFVSRWIPAVRLLILSLILISGHSLLAAQSVILTWSPSSDTNVTGYNVYYGSASRVYTNKLDVGTATNATINGLVEGVTYYFAATAYNILGVESDYSVEVSYVVPGGNQTPTLNILSTLTINEDAPQQTVNLTGITAGGTESQPLTVTATSSNPGLIPTPVVNYTSPGSSGTLTFTPVPNANGTSTITVTVDDGQSANNTVTRTFTVTVNAVNDAPTLNALSNLTINEDAGAQSVSLAGISSGAANESQTLTVTATSSNTGLIPNPTVSYASPNGTGTLSFTPVANANGTATITVTVNDGQAANNTISRTFTVTVNPVNDAPTLAAIGNVALSPNSGLKTVNLSGIGSGAANEIQTLTVTASSSNPGLIPNPTVAYTSPNATGSLSFTPIAGASGSAVITVTVNDGAGSNNSVSRTFTVTVSAAPTITAIPNQTISVNSNTGPIGFVIGDSDTPVANLTLSAASSVTSLLPVNAIVFGGSGANRTVTLTPKTGATGSTIVTITVSDGAATTSTTLQLDVLGVPTAPQNLTVATSGGGTVASTDPARMLAGKTYALTAVPDEGSEFVGWTGDVVSTSPKISVSIRGNVFVQANFVPSPYRLGSYNGLFYENDQVRRESSGSFSVMVTKHGFYSGRLQQGKTKYAFTGHLALDCRATNNITPKFGRPLVLHIQTGTNDLADQIFGELTDGNWVATLRGDRSVFSAVNPAPFAGNYTLVIPGKDDGASVPRGHGYGTVRISTLGKILFSGMLADGTKVSQSTSISKDGAWPLYASLYKDGGLLVSWMNFVDRANDDVNGTVNWIKSANAVSKLYPQGFNVEADAVGSRFVATPGVNVLKAPSATVAFEGGNLSADFENLVQIDSYNKVLNTSSNPLSLAFVSTTGLFKGKVTDPVSGASYSFGGAVLQKAGKGYGYLLGSSLSSAVEIQP